ncbi:type II 3-dehydroquinate dehydratase [Propioniciclava coleopterorum]|uniref:3-dehydroquinate dehydratase n=1 Tax=Propioniciclava coleopterorum TaxID=2714937 RepID=A0A6G7Y3V6_9ACTN|nr:type II 3-dehydroquinate dehydratase [Propioniciclava coleopterorum]QIK71328.1 type II 3-dehydroquinate dehydratase [Propioniciclava coleopterorum]
MAGRRVLVLNGVNLGRLGQRQPEVYGATTHAQLAGHLERTGAGLGLDVEVRQTDHEGEFVGWLHEAASQDVPVVLNPGAWSHYSYAIADAVVQVPFAVEVHISNVHQREAWRHTMVISPYVRGTILGLGLGGYDLALAHVAAALVEPD